MSLPQLPIFFGLFLVFEDVFPVFAKHVKVAIDKDERMSLERNQRQAAYLCRDLHPLPVYYQHPVQIYSELPVLTFDLSFPFYFDSSHYFCVSDDYKRWFSFSYLLSKILECKSRMANGRN